MKKIHWLIFTALLATSPAFAAPKLETADTRDSTDTVDTMNDPWEGFNRCVFDLNLFLDRNIEKPFITVYREIPQIVRKDFGNFLSNLGEPLNTIHGVLQANPKITFTSFWRFVLNTTFGFGGIRDFAGEQGLHNMDQDLGKTFGHWGVPTGPYLVLPVLGPSSVRDTTGKVGDWFLDPVGWELNTPQTIGQVVADGIDARDTNNGLIDQLYYQSFDPYVASRSVYRQHESFLSKKKD